ncbi:beta-ketoacyl-ACP synthase 3 [Frankia sp. AgB32]|uniref:beta-ketoacyl-ACP synthase 3 n=1 Tax=Frankia sp. AgB32 TaxID=631119 RepID=UPI00200CA5AD|nr:beta-ketoacyl-ACP synthase 3 [Frankia sp. AgB32]MCK9893515.1 beta-ketoacyl-ACP synthase 3 [Frankia sp. AgB32]
MADDGAPQAPRCVPQAAGAQLTGLGVYRPAGRLGNEELGERFGRPPEWIRTRTGFGTRQIAAADETVHDMALRAARDAVLDSHVPPEQIDLIIAASCSVDRSLGGVAAWVAAELGADRANVFDLNAACAGFCYAIATAADAIRVGSARHAVVVAAEKMTAWVDPNDLGTSIIFGDGAGAAVLGVGDPSDIGPVVWGSDGSAAELIHIIDKTQWMHMEGQAVFRWATTTIPAIALAACDAAGVAPTDLAAVIPHQANLRIVDTIATRLGATGAVVARDGADSGNTSAASIPLALHRLRHEREIASGDLALLVGFGAGLSWAAQVIRVP